MNKCIDYDKSCQDRYWWLNKTGGTAHDNMTVLDYFAAQAMVGLLTGDAVINESDTSVEWLNKTAVAAYEVATAMMKERTKQESNDA